jgi:autotransporter-associated beta strand protein
LSIGTAANVGSGTVEIGGAGTLSTTANLTRTAGLAVTDASAGAVLSAAANTTFTQTGAFTGAPTATTKIGKAGAGTLIFNAVSGSSYGGQIQIGEGTVIAGTSTALGTNASTANRGIDLGFNVGDVSQANNVALLASNGVTVAQSVYVAPNTGNALRTIGLAGAGSATFSNQFFMDGNLTVNAGANATDLVTISGGMVNTGGLNKIGSGTLLLSGANTYSGQTTVSNGVLIITNGTALADTGVLQLDNTSGVSANVAQSETLGSLRGGGASGTVLPRLPPAPRPPPAR